MAVDVSKHPGATTDQIEHNLEYWARNYHPGRVVISVGINDIIMEPKKPGDKCYGPNTVDRIINIWRKAKLGAIRDVCILELLDVSYNDNDSNAIDK